MFIFNHQYMVHTYRPIQHNVYTRYASLIGIGNRFWLWFGYDNIGLLCVINYELDL